MLVKFQYDMRSITISLIECLSSKFLYLKLCIKDRFLYWIINLIIKKKKKRLNGK